MCARRVGTHTCACSFSMTHNDTLPPVPCSAAVQAPGEFPQAPGAPYSTHPAGVICLAHLAPRASPALLTTSNADFCVDIIPILGRACSCCCRNCIHILPNTAAAAFGLFMTSVAGSKHYAARCRAIASAGKQGTVAIGHIAAASAGVNGKATLALTHVLGWCHCCCTGAIG
mgnify:CR=1 FL=1